MNETKILFEISWEVCNKVGGIYTVVSSKMEQAIIEFGENLILIGPLLDQNPDFDESSDKEMAIWKHKLYSAGITARCGRWNIPGRPKTILVAVDNIARGNEILYFLWEHFGVDSLNSGWDYEEPALFGIQAGRVIEALSGLYSGMDMIAHFHEWMTGSGLLWLNYHVPQLATVFTTHATVPGRSMAGNGMDLYKDMKNINPHRMASGLNVIPKYSLEKMSAKYADCFTTVSDITSDEAAYLLEEKPTVILPNGYSVPIEKDGSDRKVMRSSLLDFASGFTNDTFDPGKTLLLVTSGRYEFRNKGLDILLEALHHIQEKKLLPQGNKIVAFFLIATGNQGSRSEADPNKPNKIATHLPYNPDSDPILNTCLKFNLQNNKDQQVKIVFVPAYLAETDPLFPFNYYDALKGCDLSVFPSYYEPWGYTPLESITYGVPTITTNLAGFGLWAEKKLATMEGIHILDRKNLPAYQIADQLANLLISYSQLPEEMYFQIEQAVLQAASEFSWENFYNFYKKAYTTAEENRNKRMKEQTKNTSTNSFIEISGANSNKPRLRSFAVRTILPARIERLRELAFNLWWCWNTEAYQLFNRLDPDLFMLTGNNPVSLLENINPETLEYISSQEDYLQQYESVLGNFDRYMSDKESLLDITKNISSKSPIAYFSMEYGFHESIPIYSGGLGILSGDHIKSASDLNIPLVGIGLLYRKGYFKQGINSRGEQIMKDFRNDFSRMPVSEWMINKKPVEIKLEYPGREVFAKVWKVQAGRVPVYLLDTDIIKNSPADREITGRLYGGGKVKRIEQEILLGIGGIKLLDELNISPALYHLNEGHSSFLLVQRVINQMKYNKLDFDTACLVVKSSTVFTTHTPVPAGNETFNMQLITGYLKDYVEKNDLGWDQFMAMAGRNPGDSSEFEMTVLALKNSLIRNGVSKLHGVVSRKMWQRIWDSLLVEEVPVDHVTNGVHVPTWLHAEIKNLFARYGMNDLNKSLLNKNYWQKIYDIPDQEIWSLHQALKTRFFNYLKERVSAHWMREGESPAIIDKLRVGMNSSKLTIGFARRFATYKRATLLLNDFDRFKKIVFQDKHPVQFVFAGKAHPDDVEGQKFIQKIVQLSKTEEFIGKLIFVEDYDIRLARKLVASVDVWLNNPLRPHEASGTSGMKTAINGVINCSILDGWWDEAYNKNIGWAIGDRKEVQNFETQNIIDSNSLYSLLENEIIPMYYNRNNNGIPASWVQMMKHSMMEVISQFNTNRMLNDYLQKLYQPTANASEKITGHNFAPAKLLSTWQNPVAGKFADVQIVQLKFNDKAGNDLDINECFEISLLVNKGKFSKGELKAQMVIIPDHHIDNSSTDTNHKYLNDTVEIHELELINEKDNILEFRIEYKAQKSGKYNYGVRVLPFHPDFDYPGDMNLVVWA